MYKRPLCSVVKSRLLTTGKQVLEVFIRNAQAQHQVIVDFTVHMLFAIGEEFERGE
jgi:hypothetical protein